MHRPTLLNASDQFFSLEEDNDPPTPSPIWGLGI